MDTEAAMSERFRSPLRTIADGACIRSSRGHPEARGVIFAFALDDLAR